MDKKVCTSCKEEKPLSDYLFRSKEKGTYHSSCRECYKKIRRRSYLKRNGESDKKRSKRNRQKNREWFKEYKDGLSCIRCSEDHPSCIVFHHSDPVEKYENVSTMVSEGYGKERILNEINKCIVLCPNCHSKEHYNEESA